MYFEEVLGTLTSEQSLWLNFNQFRSLCRLVIRWMESYHHGLVWCSGGSGGDPSNGAGFLTNSSVGHLRPTSPNPVLDLFSFWCKHKCWSGEETQQSYFRLEQKCKHNCKYKCQMKNWSFFGSEERDFGTVFGSVQAEEAAKRKSFVVNWHFFVSQRKSMQYHRYSGENFGIAGSLDN